MRQLRLAACVAAGILTASVGNRAAAQGTQGYGYIPPRPGGISPITNPVYSPYLNLLRPGGNLQQNYFGLVRPEFDLRNAAGTLQQQVYQNDQAINNLAAYGPSTGFIPLVTGHTATFLNTGGHFQNLRGSGGAASALQFGPIAGGGYGSAAGGFGAGGRSFGTGAGGLGAGGYGASSFGAAGGLRPGVPSVGGVGGSGGYGASPIR
jgi:hypothetical protein